MHWRRKWQPTPHVLAWRIPGTGEPGGLPSMESLELDTTEATQQQQKGSGTPAGFELNCTPCPKSKVDILIRLTSEHNLMGFLQR